MGIRVFLAIALCKVLRWFSRVLHRGGTAMPGRLALKVCPRLLAVLAKDVKTIAVTGTNGKTTSSRMLEEALAQQGENYFANRSGANLISGITTEFVMNCTLDGKMKKHLAVIECDEAAARTVFGQLKPEVIVVTNLFRDQLDRYGEVTHTLANVREGIKGAPNAVLCLNADCSLTASLADDLPNRVIWFGVDQGACTSAPKPEISDATHCIRCKTEYAYDYITYGHLGGYRCPHCGYARHKADYSVQKVRGLGISGSDITVSCTGSQRDVSVNLPAMYNIYNAIGAIAALCTAGYSAESACTAVEQFKCGFGRMEQFDNLGKAGTKMMLVKNPAGCSQVVEFMSSIREDFALAVCLNDRGADGTDISWIWDADFDRIPEFGSRLKAVAVSGDRAADMRVRLKYAGVDDSRILVEPDYEKLVAWMEQQEVPVFVMPTYTAMLELREVVIRHCGGAEFWE